MFEVQYNQGNQPGVSWVFCWITLGKEAEVP